ncbi:hypothetical protein RCL1_006037 [Eukaryota sp. TZLM3-RCL]
MPLFKSKVPPKPTPKDYASFILQTSLRSTFNGFFQAFMFELVSSTVRSSVNPKLYVPMNKRIRSSIQHGKSMAITQGLYSACETSLVCLTKREGTAITSLSCIIAGMLSHPGNFRKKVRSTASFTMMTLSSDLMVGKPFLRPVDISFLFSNRSKDEE